MLECIRFCEILMLCNIPKSEIDLRYLNSLIDLLFGNLPQNILEEIYQFSILF